MIIPTLLSVALVASTAAMDSELVDSGDTVPETGEELIAHAIRFIHIQRARKSPQPDEALWAYLKKHLTDAQIIVVKKRFSSTALDSMGPATCRFRSALSQDPTVLILQYAMYDQDAKQTLTGDLAHLYRKGRFKREPAGVEVTEAGDDTVNGWYVRREYECQACAGTGNTKKDATRLCNGEDAYPEPRAQEEPQPDADGACAHCQNVRYVRDMCIPCNGFGANRPASYSVYQDWYKNHWYEKEDGCYICLAGWSGDWPAGYARAPYWYLHKNNVENENDKILYKCQVPVGHDRTLPEQGWEVYGEDSESQNEAYPALKRPVLTLRVVD